MTPEQKIEAIKLWQENKNFHPATCHNSEHGPLGHERMGNEIVLACQKCMYIQRVPSILYAYYLTEKENGKGKKEEGSGS